MESYVVHWKLQRHLVGNVDLRLGTFVGIEHRKFMLMANKIFVNNAEGTFSTVISGKRTLDSYLAGLFALARPGTIMVTIDRVLSLGRSLSEENEVRRRNGLQESPDASFFECTKKSLGCNAVSWSFVNEIIVFVHTRVHQSSKDGNALFLCSDKVCNRDRNGKMSRPTAVVQSTEEALLHNNCIYCEQRRYPLLRGRELLSD